MLNHPFIDALFHDLPEWQPQQSLGFPARDQNTQQQLSCMSLLGSTSPLADIFLQRLQQTHGLSGLIALLNQRWYAVYFELWQNWYLGAPHCRQRLAIISQAQKNDSITLTQRRLQILATQFLGNDVILTRGECCYQYIEAAKLGQKSCLNDNMILGQRVWTRHRTFTLLSTHPRVSEFMAYAKRLGLTIHHQSCVGMSLPIRLGRITLSHSIC